MKSLITKLKQQWCKWFGHVWRVKIVEITSTYTLRHDFCQRCGIRENWQLVKDEETR